MDLIQTRSLTLDSTLARLETKILISCIFIVLSSCLDYFTCIYNIMTIIVSCLSQWSICKWLHYRWSQEGMYYPHHLKQTLCGHTKRISEFWEIYTLIWILHSPISYKFHVPAHGTIWAWEILSLFPKTYSTIA